VKRLFSPTLLFLLAIQTLSAPFSYGQGTENQTDSKGRKQGLWKKLDAEGHLVYEGQFKDDKPVGLFKHYYSNGKLKATNNYFNNGKKAAAHIYFPGGTLQAAGVYFEQKKDSLWKFYDDQEHLLSEEIYDKGKKVGDWKVYYPSGKLLRVEHYNSDVKVGQWLMYYENGNVQQEINYTSAGKLDGDFKIFTKEGKPSIEGKYRNDLPASNWFYYDQSGKILYIEQYKGGKLAEKKWQNGVKEESYPNGIPKSKYTYKSGKKNGEFVEYYNAGEFKRRRKVKDPNSIIDAADPNEEWEEYLDGQKVKVRGTYKDDQLVGEVIYYTLDGKVEKKEKHGY
jgi:antitoxin component YwqK of YwqJK toxin-antitoxin module